MQTIDLNADLGEGQDSDAELLSIVSSCNIACGGHAGNRASMRETVRLAVRAGVNIGAHPAYPDREGFGRRSHFLTGAKLYDSLSEQVLALSDVSADLGVAVGHVKAHGALYNDARKDPDLAGMLARVALESPGRVALVGQPGSAVERAAQDLGVAFFAEGFVDRAYAADGALVPRSEIGAVFEDRDTIAAQAVSIAARGQARTRSGRIVALRADTLCLHGDTPDAAGAAVAVRDALQAAGVDIQAFGRHTHE